MQVLLEGPRATLAVAPERGARPISTTLNLTPAYWARSCRLTFKCEHHHIYRMADHEVSLSRSVIMDLGERWRVCRFRSNRHSTTGLWNRRQIEQRTPAHAAETASSQKRSDANTRSPDGICARAFQSD